MLNFKFGFKNSTLITQELKTVTQKHSPISRLICSCITEQTPKKNQIRHIYFNYGIFFQNGNKQSRSAVVRAAPQSSFPIASYGGRKIIKAARKHYEIFEVYVHKHCPKLY